ncbi:hypothetical protein BJX65DRAFT_184231 [Aspergillus insuetus]
MICLLRNQGNLLISQLDSDLPGIARHYISGMEDCSRRQPPRADTALGEDRPVQQQHCTRWECQLVSERRINHVKHRGSVLGYDCIVVLLVDCFVPKVSVKRRPFRSLLASGFQRVGQDLSSQAEIAGDGIFRVGLSGEALVSATKIPRMPQQGLFLLICRS